MSWASCKNILVIRPDNMGDLIMSSPAIRALKETFGCRITVLTSHLAAEAAKLIPEIDDTIITSVPWVKNGRPISPDELMNLTQSIKARNFDACVVFTVYSQNPMPSAMLAWIAGIPKRLSYCRENPYDVINYWLPDPEPYNVILHQVERDLKLVKHVSATTSEQDIRLEIPTVAIDNAKTKLDEIMPGVTDFVVVHAGVSDLKRAYPLDKWIQLAKSITLKLNLPVVFTGVASEKPLTDNLQKGTGNLSYSTAGIFTLTELAAVLYKSRMLISVNTGPVHIASGLKLPVIVLYAQTNPQHTPWMTECSVFEYSIESNCRSKNEVIKHVDRTIYKHPLPYPEVSEIIQSMQILLSRNLVR